MGCWEVFSFYVLTLFGAPNGIGSLPDAGYSFQRYDHCQYNFLGYDALHILHGWFYYSRKYDS
ncbi:hypothetical protein Ancab_011435 [Ancistrocladus abbreviatus]